MYDPCSLCVGGVAPAGLRPFSLGGGGAVIDIVFILEGKLPLLVLPCGEEKKILMRRFSTDKLQSPCSLSKHGCLTTRKGYFLFGFRLFLCIFKKIRLFHSKDPEFISTGYHIFFSISKPLGF